MSTTSFRPRQRPSISLLEASTNVAVGFVLALAMQGLVYPLFGIHTTIMTDGAIAVIFTLVSLVRSYLVRRTFETLAAEGVIGERRADARP